MRIYMTFGLILTLSVLSVTAIAQKQPAIAWQKSLGGSGNDRGATVCFSPDGGFIVCGTSNSTNGDITTNYGDDDIWIAKLSRFGVFQWEKSYGDVRADIAGQVVRTSDKGYIIGGTTWPFFVPPTDTNHLQWWIFKIDSVGTKLWEKKYGGSSPDNLSWVDISVDGSIYCLGHSTSNNRDFPVNKGSYDIWVFKLDPDGNVIWKHPFAGSGDDRGYQIRATSDGGCVLVGKTASTDGDMVDNHTGSADGFVAKLTSTGEVEWKKVYGTPGAESFNAVTPLSEGGYLVAGITQGAGEPNGDFDILRLNAAGNIIWEKFYGGSGRDEATAVLEIGNGGYQVLGTSTSVIDSIPTHRGVSDWLVYRLDTAGNNGANLFSRWFGGSGEDKTGGSLIFAFPGYVSVGTTNSDNGDVTSNHGNADIWVVRYGGTPGEVDDENLVPIAIYPNPAHDQISIAAPMTSGNCSATIENSVGEVLKKFTLRDSAVNIRDLASGMYVVTIYQNDVAVSRQKFVKD